MNLLNFKLFSRTFLLFCGACVSQTNANAIAASDKLISKTYYIKGMTCGGCAYQINKSLDGDLSSIKYANKKTGVGEVILIFKNENYKGAETDCKVKKSIEGKTDYKIFVDEKYKTPICANKHI